MRRGRREERGGPPTPARPKHDVLSQVLCKKTWKQWEFPCGQWLHCAKGDKKTARELLPGAMDAAGVVRYLLRVRTASEAGAGTDATVYAVPLSRVSVCASAHS